MLVRTLCCFSCGFLVVAGCGTAGGGTADGGADSGGAIDGGARVDAASGTDSGADASSGTDSGSGSEGGPGIDAGTTVDAGTSSMGDCLTDADCPGGTCVALVPGGYRVCRVTPVPATGCEPGRGDACCTSADCAMGTCFLGPIHPSCGGVFRAPNNECGVDECATNADCTDGVCAPAGTFAPVATCVSASCFHDADCTAEVGGHCVIALDPCCSIPVGLVCSYDRDGCRTSADCAAGYCNAVGGRARCDTGGGPFCPL